MKITLKVNACEVQDDEVQVLLDREEFYAMLDRVHPRALANYLSTRMKPKQEGGKKC